MRPIQTVVMVVVSGLLVAGDTWAESPAVLLEKGVYQEETVGDLDGAVAIYEEIVEAADAARPHVAQAWHRLGMCYLRLDQKAKAQTALERVVGDFADQAELVSRARETLAGLLPAPDFPEVEGCRLVETMHLELSETPVPEDARQHIDLYEGGLLEIAWTTSPALEKKLQDPGGYFVVAVCPKALWDPNGMDLKRCSWLELVPGSARSTRYGQSWPEEESPVEQPATPLQAGEYLVAVSANKTREGGSPPWESLGYDYETMFTLTVLPMPYTQITLDDVQPDGTIRFENILQAVNGSDESIREDQFCNSDFVHVTEMFDADGRPLSFTTKHRDRNFHYRVTLNTPVPPGEPLLFGSRGTQTGLVKPVPGAKDEFRYRMTHWPSSNKTTRRVEIHRLPDGAELLETVPADMTRRTRDGRVELHVEKLIEPGGSIHTEYRYRLAGGSVQKALDIGPPPWVDGERMQLALKAPVGTELGTIIYTARKREVDGVPAWRLDTFQVVSVSNALQFMRVDARQDTFAPIFGRTKNDQGDFHATYSEGEVELTVAGANGENSKRVPLDQVAYDNEQALYLIRRLPLAEGYAASFPIFSVQGGVVVECRINVVGAESVAVPAGTFPCLKTELSIYLGEVRTLQHQLWFSSDENRYLVRYDAGSAVMELTDARATDASERERFEDDILGVSLELPLGWRYYAAPSKGDRAFSVQILPPEMEAWCLFTAKPGDASERTTRRVAEGDVAILGGYFEEYTVRPDSWVESEHAGMPSAAYVADYRDKGKDMVEYRVYALGESAVYWFVFRVTQGRFGELRPGLDAVVDGLRLRDGPGGGPGPKPTKQGSATTPPPEPPREVVSLSIEGDWRGVLSVAETQFELVFHFAKGPAGQVTATIDSVSQGVTGIPVDEVRLNDNRLFLKANSIGASLDSRLSLDAQTLEGQWTQPAGTWPLVLRREE